MRKGRSHINITRIQLAALSDKVTRLQHASAALSNNIAELESLKTKIDSLMVDGGIWRGKTENTFTDQYETLKDTIKTYIARSEDQKVAINDDIKRAASLQASLKSILAENTSKG